MRAFCKVDTLALWVSWLHSRLIFQVRSVLVLALGYGSWLRRQNLSKSSWFCIQATPEISVTSRAGLLPLEYSGLRQQSHDANHTFTRDFSAEHVCPPHVSAESFAFCNPHFCKLQGNSARRSAMACKASTTAAPAPNPRLMKRHQVSKGHLGQEIVVALQPLKSPLTCNWHRDNFKATWGVLNLVHNWPAFVHKEANSYL